MPFMVSAGSGESSLSSSDRHGFENANERPKRAAGSSRSRHRSSVDSLSLRDSRESLIGTNRERIQDETLLPLILRGLFRERHLETSVELLQREN